MDENDYCFECGKVFEDGDEVSGSPVDGYCCKGGCPPVKHPICPFNCYFEGDEDKCNIKRCDYGIDNVRGCTGTCEIKGDKNMAGDKYDEGKNRLGLIPPEIIEAVGRILTHGASKYAPRNWQKGISYEKIYGAMQRHLQKFWNGEKFDSESGLPHLDHAACNLAFLITYEAHPEEYEKFDDRYLYLKGVESDDNDIPAEYRIKENSRCGWYIVKGTVYYLHKDLQVHMGTGYAEAGDPPYGEAPGYYPTKEIAEAYLQAYLNKKE